MDRFVGRLLSELHAAIPVPVCPGDWAWTTTIAGGLIALLPMFGAIMAAVARRWTGNRYGPGQLALFAAIGLTMTALLPWLTFRSTSEVFRRRLDGEASAIGLTASDVDSLGNEFCFGTVQGSYLGGARSVREVLGEVSGSRPGVFVGAVGLLVLLPLLCWLFVLIQARLAFRRGPKWPARLLWVPMLGLVLGTASQSATVVAHLWLGFLPTAVVAMLGVVLVGAPRWSVIERRAAAASQVPPPSMAPSGGQGGEQRGDQRGDQQLASHGGQRPASRPPPPRGQQHQQHQQHRPPVQQPRRSPTAPFGRPDPAPPAQPPSPARVLASDPGPIPETLQRALGLGTAPAAAPERPEPPTLPASRFRRIRPLGSGGFGTVWLAMDTALDRTVAVKAAKVPDAETERRIRREARALAAVHHPNCVRIYDILTDTDGELALIMEYVPGRSLSAEIDEGGRLSDPAAARMWSILAAALGAAHAKGVLHRDVKPSNIIIDEAGYPHLIDFGIARATGDITLTAAGMVLGTPDYMAPEVAAGKPASSAADVWQLAATVSFALAGLPPRGHRDGAVAAMLAAAQGEPCNQLPEGSVHRALLERALDPDPARRPSLGTVQSELGRWLAAIGQQLEGPVTQRMSAPAAAQRPPGHRPPMSPPRSPAPSPSHGSSLPGAPSPGSPSLLPPALVPPGSSRTPMRPSPQQQPQQPGRPTPSQQPPSQSPTPAYASSQSPQQPLSPSDPSPFGPRPFLPTPAGASAPPAPGSRPDLPQPPRRDTDLESTRVAPPLPDTAAAPAPTADPTDEPTTRPRRRRAAEPPPTAAVRRPDSTQAMRSPELTRTMPAVPPMPTGPTSTPAPTRSAQPAASTRPDPPPARPEPVDKPVAAAQPAPVPPTPEKPSEAAEAAGPARSAKPNGVAEAARPVPVTPEASPGQAETPGAAEPPRAAERPASVGRAGSTAPAEAPRSVERGAAADVAATVEPAGSSGRATAERAERAESDARSSSAASESAASSGRSAQQVERVESGGRSGLDDVAGASEGTVRVGSADNGEGSTEPLTVPDAAAADAMGAGESTVADAMGAGESTVADSGGSADTVETAVADEQDGRKEEEPAVVATPAAKPAPAAPLWPTEDMP